MLRLTESICLIAAAGLYAAPAFADLADLGTDACSGVPAHAPPMEQPFSSGQTARSSAGGDAGSSAGLPYGIGEVDAAASAGDEVMALMQMHHVLAQETSDGEARAVSNPSALRGALMLLDSVTGSEQHFPARLRALVYDTDEPPALGAWSVRWEAAAGSHATVNTFWGNLPGEWLAPLHATLAELQSLLEVPSRPSAAAASRPATAYPEPDAWAVLLAGALSIGTIVRLRLLS